MFSLLFCFVFWCAWTLSLQRRITKYQSVNDDCNNLPAAALIHGAAFSCSSWISCELSVSSPPPCSSLAPVHSSPAPQWTWFLELQFWSSSVFSWGFFPGGSLLCEAPPLQNVLSRSSSPECPIWFSKHLCVISIFIFLLSSCVGSCILKSSWELTLACTVFYKVVF